jgi:hypothetical protein
MASEASETLALLRQLSTDVGALSRHQREIDNNVKLLRSEVLEMQTNLQLLAKTRPVTPAALGGDDPQSPYSGFSPNGRRPKQQEVSEDEKERLETIVQGFLEGVGTESAAKRAKASDSPNGALVRRCCVASLRFMPVLRPDHPFFAGWNVFTRLVLGCVPRVRVRVRVVAPLHTPDGRLPTPSLAAQPSATPPAALWHTKRLHTPTLYGSCELHRLMPPVPACLECPQLCRGGTTHHGGLGRRDRP